MSPADQARFAAIVQPLTAWVADGSVWAVAIQDGKLTANPEVRDGDVSWEEVRLEAFSGRGSLPEDWVLWYLPFDGRRERVVYTGLIPDRQTFCHLIWRCYGARDWANLLLTNHG